MGPEDQHEQPFDQDAYDLWMTETRNAAILDEIEKLSNGEIQCDSTNDLEAADVSSQRVVKLVQELRFSLPVYARGSQWKRLPDEQAWWWYWIGSDYTVPHICSVMVSKTGAKDRYFVADGNLAPWCDEMEGFWLKIEYPNIPSRAEQKRIVGASQREASKERIIYIIPLKSV
jgi:hypothetical protein